MSIWILHVAAKLDCADVSFVLLLFSLVSWVGEEEPEVGANCASLQLCVWVLVSFSLWCVGWGHGACGLGHAARGLGKSTCRYGNGYPVCSLPSSPSCLLFVISSASSQLLPLGAEILAFSAPEILNWMCTLCLSLCLLFLLLCCLLSSLALSFVFPQICSRPVCLWDRFFGFQMTRKTQT